MRNRVFSLRACNERGAACGHHRWPCCKSFHVNNGQRFRRASFNADGNRDQRLRRAFLGSTGERQETGAQDIGVQDQTCTRAVLKRPSCRLAAQSGPRRQT